MLAPGPTSRSVRRNGFTLLELLTVVAIISLVAGMMVILTSGATRRSDEQIVKAECAEMRKAVLRFHADMGEPPRYLAELLQSPDPGVSGGGWWWRTTALDARLYSFDPATRRGWNGPYVKASVADPATTEAGEARLVAGPAYERINSDLSVNHRLPVIESRYGSFPQRLETVPARVVSHYQLDRTDVNELAIRFVREPLAAPADAEVVLRLGLGVKP